MLKVLKLRNPALRMHIYWGNSRSSIELHTAVFLGHLGFLVSRETVAVTQGKLALSGRKRSMCGTWALSYIPLFHSSYGWIGPANPAKSGCLGLPDPGGMKV